ncbi:MAG: phage holin [Syntrophomonadaceae bacterium]|nr:phage holin [Syntrophomonadaceae bacterium]
MFTEINKKVFVRTVVLMLALVNQGLVLFGRPPLPIDDDMITNAFTLVFTIGAALWSWWKNNSFTKEALTADEYLKELRKLVK